MFKALWIFISIKKMHKLFSMVSVHQKLRIIVCLLAIIPAILLSVDAAQRAQERAFTDIVFVSVDCNQPPLMSFCKKVWHDPFAVCKGNYEEFHELLKSVQAYIDFSLEDFQKFIESRTVVSERCNYQILSTSLIDLYKKRICQISDEFLAQIKRQINKKMECHPVVAREMLVAYLPTESIENLFTGAVILGDLGMIMAGMLYGLFGSEKCIWHVFNLWHNFIFNMIVLGKCQTTTVFRDLVEIIGVEAFFMMVALRLPFTLISLYIKFKVSRNLHVVRNEKKKLGLAIQCISKITKAHVDGLSRAAGTM